MVEELRAILNTEYDKLFEPVEEEDLFIFDDEKIKKKRKKEKPRKLTNKELKIQAIIDDTEDYMEAPNPVLMKTPFSLLLIANKGAGKTTTLCNIMRYYRGHFDEIHLFSPTVHLDNKWACMIDEFELDDEHIHESYEEKYVKKLVKSIEKFNINKRGGDKVKILMIFDDIVMDLPKNNRRTIFNKLSMNHRHYFISTMVISQSFKALDTKVRSNATAFALYRTENIEEKLKIVKELAGSVGRKKFTEIYNMATGKKFGFLFINYDNLFNENYMMENFDRPLASKTEFADSSNSSDNEAIGFDDLEKNKVDEEEDAIFGKNGK